MNIIIYLYKIAIGLLHYVDQSQAVPTGCTTDQHASHDLHLQSLATIGGSTHTCRRAIANDWIILLILFIETPLPLSLTCSVVDWYPTSNAM